MTDLNKIYELADKWIKGTITAEEKKYFEDWYNQEATQHPGWSLDLDEKSLKNRIFYNIVKGIKRKKQKGFNLSHGKHMYKWYSGAAAIVIVTISIWIYQDLKSSDQMKAEAPASQINLPPGRDAATLTLSNGSVIDLDVAQNGEITTQGKTTVSKIAGQVAYIPQIEEKNLPVIYNTLNTARGNQYHLLLADSTRIWLNAESSIHFPTVFSGDKRLVELTGEAYFEVAKNSSMPFLVKVNGIEVEVLGTHFNINAYADESIVETTLLEGSVKVQNNNTSVLIKPGERAVIKNNENEIKVSEADIEKVMAWQKGFFEFDQMELHAVMRQISRWYNVDVRYEGQSFNKKFGGRISKNLNLGDILTLLQENGIEFSLEGKTLVVKP